MSAKKKVCETFLHFMDDSGARHDVRRAGRYGSEGEGRVMELQIKMPEPRPCTVSGKRALLHTFFVHAWTHGAAATIGGFSAGQETKPCALVEYQNGDVDYVGARAVHLLDSAEVFKQYSFEEESNE